MKYSASVFNGARDICYIVLPLSYLFNVCQNEGLQNKRSSRHPKTERKIQSHLFFYKQLTRNNSIWRDVLNSEPIMNGKAQTGRFRQSDTDENKGLWFNDPCPHVHSYFYKQSFPCFRFILFSFHWMYAKSTANQQVEIIIL